MSEPLAPTGFSNKEIDYLTEMMNIGAGNAAAALAQVLDKLVDLETPKTAVLPVATALSGFVNPDQAVAATKMKLIGDVRGTAFFIVPEEHRADLVELMRQAAPGQPAITEMGDLSALTELGNIIAGVYLTAVHDFCRLNIYHSVGVTAVDMIQALLDEFVAAVSREARDLLIVENVFTIDHGPIKTFFILIPAPESFSALKASLARVLGSDEPEAA